MCEALSGNSISFLGQKPLRRCEEKVRNMEQNMLASGLKDFLLHFIYAACKCYMVYTSFGIYCIVYTLVYTPNTQRKAVRHCCTN